MCLSLDVTTRSHLTISHPILKPSLPSCSYKGMSWWGRTNVSARPKGTETPCAEFPPAESHRGKAPWLVGFRAAEVEMASVKRTSCHVSSIGIIWTARTWTIDIQNPSTIPKKEWKNLSKSPNHLFRVLVVGSGSLWKFCVRIKILPSSVTWGLLH